jgi:hypothetical protein
MWHGLTAVLVIAALAMSLAQAAIADGGTFSSPVVRAFNVFAFFTIQSNVIVCVTCLLLALRPDRSSLLFRTFRLDGVVMIVITAVVYHTALAGLFDLHGWRLVSDQLVHTVVPAFAILGWLVFGPRGLITWRVVGLSAIYPILWVVFTLVRGAIGHWYPYPFIDIDELGYLRVSLTLLGITAAFVALAAAAFGLDRLLVRAGWTPAGARESE